MEDITNRLITQSTYMMNAQSQQFINTDISNEPTNDTDTDEEGWFFAGQISRFIFMTSSVIISTLIAALFSMLIPTLTRGSRNLSFNLKELTDRIGLTTPLSEILLESITCMSNYGPESITITSQKIAVLHYLKKNMKNYKDLFKLKEKDNSRYEYNENTGNEDCISNQFYEVNQSRPIIISKKGRSFIRIKCTNDSFEREGNSNRSAAATREKIFKMHIQSNYGLKPINEFINKCICEWEEDKKKDKTRYMYTYLGLNSKKIPIYERHIFKPYAKFNGLVGETAKTVQDDFQFFTSKEGEEWYNNRNLPYQITHCYHGLPGTGKSILACAVAQKHNLHIVRIRLSDIKDNQEFVKVLRNTEYNGNTYEYKDILYLFDEFDTELEKLANSNDDIDTFKLGKSKNKLKKKSKSNQLEDIESDDAESEEETDIENIFEDINGTTMDEKTKKIIMKHIEGLKSTVSNKSDLSIGVILEELNGINQMYGRKMIIITNKIEMLKTIHKGAFVRPGRIDKMCELKNMTIQEINDLLILMYGDEIKDYDKLNDYLEENSLNYKYTPAHIVNICKISKNIHEFFDNLKKY